MPSHRFIAVLTIAAAGLAAIVAAGPGGCGAGDDVPRAPQPPMTPAATATGGGDAGGTPTAPATATPGGGSATSGATSTADALDAVRALKRFCDLVDEGRLQAAAELLAGPWVWPRRELLPIARLSLASARVQKGRLGGEVVLLARLRARLRGASPLHDGVNTLFFTLGRDGTTGGWLITAVTSSP
jgi:hypothetical protein